MPRLAPLALAAALLAPAAARASVDTTLQVFDQLAYDTRVLPALGAFVRLQDPEPLKALLRDTVRQLRAHPVPPRFAGDRPAVEELAIGLEILEGSTAHDAGWLNLVKDGKPVPRAEAIRERMTFTMFPLLVDVLCLVRVDGVLQELNLWDAPLARHLYRHSWWIQDAFRGMQPPDDFGFEFSTCNATGAVPPWFVARFLHELERVPRPSDDARLVREYDLLLGMLRRVARHPAYRLVVEVC